MAKVNRRRSFIVDAPAQARMVFGISVVPMSIMLAASVAMWVLNNRLLDEAQLSNAELPSLGLLTMVQFVFVVATGTAAAFAALRYSHRVVGPAMRITRALRRIREGGLDDRITTRKGDELVEIADEVNALIGHLQTHGFAAAKGALSAGTAAAAGTPTDTRAATPATTSLVDAMAKAGAEVHGHGD